MRLRWEDGALNDLEEIAERAPVQAAAVVRAAEWLAAQQFAQLGRSVPGTGQRYWPVPPLGIFYRLESAELVIMAIADARRRRHPW
ncbi:MAG: type II toxin-antitoxin system RelE/ParE family toxin [Candidatus Dormibacteraeota bacterium]|nr:type II toxin-antitoxin system RelE/ParE family toxin [Candidatus Dormibacteraeota bacterium]